ncbi:FecR family protein [Methylobacillus gramineus]|uniref:FecR family protein n=1 Tax=Methylobacillus gramineus TaxID=755169 RepID=UPI001CFFBD67|nr:FecR family protein [Methylobacillus gramineus]MCB5185751.1 FecR family protein [Methylobacillus gramineus]
MSASSTDIAEQAAEWLIQLSDESSADTQAAFARWQQADPRHAQAVEQMQGLIGQLEGFQHASTPAHAALKAGMTPSKRRHKAKPIAGALFTLLALCLPVWIALQHYPLDYLMADISTSTAEWKSQTLADNTHITLNSNSAVDVEFDQHQRVLRLVQGEILVDVAKDAARPFVVKTEHGSITALGTRFVVSHHDHATALAMLESKVMVNSGLADHAAGTLVTQGQSVVFQQDGVGSISTIDADSLNDAWKLHQLVVQDQPLSDVLAILSRHRRGHIQFNPDELHAYRVTAVLPLDNTDHALQLLADSLPLSVRSYTPWFVLVDPHP